MNPNWTRWIIASINKHFSDAVSPFDLFIEGTDRRTALEHDYAELRRDGPEYCELSKGYWQIDITIDILVVNKLNDQDIYTLERNVGLVQSAFTTDIPVFEYGDSPLSQLGCLVLCPRPDEPIRTNYFGQVENDSRLRQVSVDACYRMNIAT